MKLVDLQERIDSNLSIVNSFQLGYFYDVGSMFDGPKHRDRKSVV